MKYTDNELMVFSALSQIDEKLDKESRLLIKLIISEIVTAEVKEIQEMKDVLKQKLSTFKETLLTIEEWLNEN